MKLEIYHWDRAREEQHIATIDDWSGTVPEDNDQITIGEYANLRVVARSFRIDGELEAVRILVRD